MPRDKYGSGDGGQDLVVTRLEGMSAGLLDLDYSYTEVIDCKAYFAKEKINSKDIRSLIGALHLVKEDFKPRAATILTTAVKPMTECAEQHRQEYNVQHGGKRLIRVIDGDEFQGGMIQRLLGKMDPLCPEGTALVKGQEFLVGVLKIVKGTGKKPAYATWD